MTIQDPKKPKVMCRCDGQGAPERVDPCIKELVDCLNRHGVRTYSSCCGHSGGQGYIAIGAECLEPFPVQNGYILHLDRKPMQNPFNVDTLEWECEEWEGAGKPWWIFARELIRGLKKVVEPEVLRQELLGDDED